MAESPSYDGPSSEPVSLRESLNSDYMRRGSIALKNNDFAEAGKWFKLAVAIWIPQKGKLAPERAEAYFKYALALLYEVPVPADDPLDDLPKEIDYLNLFDKDGITSAVKQDDADFAGSHLAHEEGSGLGVGSSKNLDSAWCVLNLALSISNVISMEKASIFSAIGEVAFRKVDFNESYKHYSEALTILEIFYPEEEDRMAHLSFKICMCLERIDKIGEAITYCTEAIRDSARRLEKLDAKLSTFSGWGWSLDDIAASCNGPVDPAYLELQAEKKRVHELQGKFENKLLHLERIQRVAAKKTS
ncbi:uncharacterized protein LOC104882611 isoform X1 [Vitis vinifera]|uniref:uncharacterized protein LOC104882611 isoform X1 n=1 Tax=Vitis vinifera TaxID=29760 RepID=UPI0008FEBD4E|nr:uncharacterized protein LOC104882611 isoform X1 [Vitis vinifera]XP_019072321.1 uncharacterized protein LOC104882611 isoform X1 [Vitis vinifera]|eukprot:XP_019072320.1 PREDICTED: uncharacterized protein LOC104882611 isoform X1 [Vitis vinifera]